MQKTITSIKNIGFSSKIHTKASIILRNPYCFENDQKSIKNQEKSDVRQNNQKVVDFIKESLWF